MLILSEFINRWARLEYDRLPASGRPRDFKTWRGMSSFQAVAKDIGSTVRRFLSLCEITESGFATADIHAVMADYELGDSDFNDGILAELCRSKGLALVTHDADFKGHGLRVLTANKRLLP